MGATQKAAHAEAERLAAAQGRSGGAAVLTGVWIPYTPAAFDQAKASGKVVIVDFTATVTQFKNDAHSV